MHQRKNYQDLCKKGSLSNISRKSFVNSIAVKLHYLLVKIGNFLKFYRKKEQHHHQQQQQKTQKTNKKTKKKTALLLSVKYMSSKVIYDV